MNCHFLKSLIAGYNFLESLPGLYTDKIDRGGGELIFQKNWGGGDYPCALVLGGVWGHAPQEMFVFRWSYIASGAFLETVVSVLGLYEVLWKNAIELYFSFNCLH